jgi:hypothetical protein
MWLRAAGDVDPSNPVVIVDQLVAKQQWPNRSPVGERLFTRAGAQDLQMTVVGVVPHLRLRSLVDTLLPQIFVPWPAALRNPIAFVVRTDRPAADIAGDLRSSVARVDPRVPIYDVRPLEEYVDSARALRRFAMLLAAAFAAFVAGSASTASCRTPSPTAAASWACGARSARRRATSCAK